MSYLVVIEPDPEPDMSWLEQSIYNPESPYFQPIYESEEDMRAGKNPINPDEYRNPNNHDAMLVTIYQNGEFLASVGSVDFYPGGSAPEGRWDVEGPDDLPPGWGEYMCQTVRDLLAEAESAPRTRFWALVHVFRTWRTFKTRQLLECAACRPLLGRIEWYDNGAHVLCKLCPAISDHLCRPDRKRWRESHRHDAMRKE